MKLQLSFYGLIVSLILNATANTSIDLKKQTQLLNKLVYQDIKVVVDKGHASENYNIKSYNIKTIQKDYNNNEVSADNTYLDKSFFVSGIINSIDKGLDKDYFLRYQNPSNEFLDSLAYMQDGYNIFLAKIKKHQQVTLYCKGGGLLLGSVTLKNCVPSEEEIKNSTNTEVQNILQKQKPKQFQIKMVNALILYLKPDSECYSEGYNISKKCSNEIDKIMEKYSHAIKHHKKQ